MNDPLSSDLQFDNPSAPNYDWQKDREWFNQRLASANIRNSVLSKRLSDALCALRVIADGTRGPKKVAADAVARDTEAKLKETTS